MTPNPKIQALIKGMGIIPESEHYEIAEAVIRECIDIVSPYAVRMENFDGGHPIADLKKHFGVEE